MPQQKEYLVITNLLLELFAFLMQHQNSAATFSNSLLAGNTLLNIFMSASLNMIWSLVNALQIIVSLPLLNVNFPQNAFVTSFILNKIANFGRIRTEATTGSYYRSLRSILQSFIGSESTILRALTSF